MTLRRPLVRSAALAVVLSASCKSTSISPPAAIEQVTVGGDAGGILVQTPNPCEVDVDFGAVAVGQQVASTIQITNSGGGDLDLMDVDPALDPEFSLDGGVLQTISPGQFDSFSVVFSPHKTGEVSSMFAIATDGQNDACPDPSSVTVVLSGAGT